MNIIQVQPRNKVPSLQLAGTHGPVLRLASALRTAPLRQGEIVVLPFVVIDNIEVAVKTPVLGWCRIDGPHGARFCLGP